MCEKIDKINNYIESEFEDSEQVKKQYFQKILKEPVQKFYNINTDNNKNNKVTNFFEYYNDKNKLKKYCKEYNINNNIALNIMYNNITFKQYYEEIPKLVKNNNYEKDKRGDINYISEVVRNWLLEDITVEYTENLKLNGKDKNREILKNPSSEADFTYKNKKVDLYTDYNTYWEDYNRLEIKKSKYNELKNNGFLLCLDLVNKKYYKLKVNPEKFKNIGKYSKLGGKKCYRYKFEDYNNINKKDLKNLKELF